MRHGAPNRRSRNRSNGGRRGNQPRAQVFDSNGPEVRIRGTAYQVHEKYMNLAKDAASTGDRVLSESYLQHAEHYQRLINSWGDAPSFQPQGGETYTPAESYEEEEEDLGLPVSITSPNFPETRQTVREPGEMAES